MTRTIQAAVPDASMGSGYSWLQDFAVYAAAANVGGDASIADLDAALASRFREAPAGHEFNASLSAGRFLTVQT
jgi:hypothetical protein